MPSRRERLTTELKNLFEQASGLDFAASDEQAHFVELGVDSLLITQLAIKLKQKYRVPINIRQLMEGWSSFSALAAHLDGALPPDRAGPPRAGAGPRSGSGGSEGNWKALISEVVAWTPPSSRPSDPAPVTLPSTMSATVT